MYFGADAWVVASCEVIVVSTRTLLSKLTAFLEEGDIVTLNLFYYLEFLGIVKAPGLCLSLDCKFCKIMD